LPGTVLGACWIRPVKVPFPQVAAVCPTFRFKVYATRYRGSGWVSGGYYEKERRRTVEIRLVAAELSIRSARLVAPER
jgi:hypothetical protein